jgi:ABC-2 type transport system permease protein
MERAAVGVATTVTREREAPAPIGAAAGSLQHDLRAAKIVWQREMMRFWQDRTRLIVSLVQPILFLFVLGTGLSTLSRGATGGLSLRTFMFPGVLAMSTMFTAMFSAASIVWDREFGFMREMLVAPIPRWAIVLGKTLGGASVATLQGMLILVLAGGVGVPYNPVLLVTLVFYLLVLSFTLTALGVVMAARIKTMQAFMAVNQLVLLPLLFLSGAMFPLSNLPTWLHVLTRIDPVTYAVDPMRRAVFDHLSVTPAVRHVLSPGLTWGSWTIAVWLEVGLVLLLGLGLLGVAIAEFNRDE